VTVTKDEIVKRLHAAYEGLLEHDRALLEVDANERSMTHKFAEHLQAEFSGWNVDCEYNRNGELPKRLVGTAEAVSTDNTDGKTVFPDVIVHHRGTIENLLVIEAKKSTTAATGRDVEKLRAYKAEHGYQFAFSVVFPVRSAASTANASSDIAEVTE
jgi:hypothetical protein